MCVRTVCDLHSADASWMNSTEACLETEADRRLAAHGWSNHAYGQERRTHHLNITESKATRMAKEEGVTLDFLREIGFVIVPGEANTAAAQAAPVEPTYNEELLAQVEALVAVAHTTTKTGKPLSTRDGRPKAVLGKNDQIGGYTVIINGSK